jgi:hypothetical protein
MRTSRVFNGLAVVVLLLAGCSEAAQDSGTTESDLQSIDPAAIVGIIQLGEVRVVDYSPKPLYRALRYAGRAGDHLEMKVTRADVAADDMRVWFARPNGSVIRTGYNGESSVDLDRDEDILLVLRQEELQVTTVSVSLTGAHASKPAFDLPDWALGHELPTTLQCRVRSPSGVKPFTVNGSYRVERGSATQPRASLIWTEPNVFDDGGDTDKNIGHDLLTRDMATLYGARAPVGLFRDPAEYNVTRDFGDRLAIEKETADRFATFFEYKQGQTPNLITVRGPSAAMGLTTDAIGKGIGFSFDRAGSNALDYPDYSIHCEGTVYAPPFATYACAAGYTEIGGSCLKPVSPIPAPRTFVDVSAGPYSTCALDTDGKATCWTSNNAFVRPERFLQVVAGEKYQCGITTDSELSCWENWGQDINWNLLPYDTFTEVAVGHQHACAIRKSDGSLRCWGSNDLGQATPPTGAFVQVVAHDDHSCAIRTDGTIACWGKDYRVLADPPAGKFTQLSASSHLFCGLRDTGAVVCWGSYAPSLVNKIAGDPTPVDIGGNYTSIVAASGAVCGFAADHKVHCERRLDSYPFEGKLLTKIAFGDAHACAVDLDGDISCYGAAHNPPAPPVMP